MPAFVVIEYDTFGGASVCTECATDSFATAEATAIQFAREGGVYSVVELMVGYRCVDGVLQNMRECKPDGIDLKHIDRPEDRKPEYYQR